MMAAQPCGTRFLASADKLVMTLRGAFCISAIFFFKIL